MVRVPGRRERTNGNNNTNGRYKGVRMRKWGKWVAEVRQPNSRDRIWLGSYTTPEEAGRAYDAAVFCLRGPNALLNFPSDPPEIPSAGVLTPAEIQTAAARHARKGLAPEPAAATEVRPPEGYDGNFEEVVIGGGGGGSEVDSLIEGSIFYDSSEIWTF